MKRSLLLAAMSALMVAFAPGRAAAIGMTHYVSPFPAGADLSCTAPGFNSIQFAVIASNPGDTIVVCDGVYSEQVTVDRNLSLVGSGNSVIQAATTGDVVTITSRASVVMSGFIVRGPGPSSCGGIQAGVRVRSDATLDLSYTTIRDIQDQPFSGCQNGEGIRVGPRGTDAAGPGHLTADNVAVTHYQKNGITVNGTGSTAKITNTTVTGVGQTAVIAQNGIQVSRGAQATISTSTMRDNYYTPKTFVACGLLIFDAAGVNDDTNVYLNNEKDKCTVSGRGGTYEGAP